MTEKTYTKADAYECLIERRGMTLYKREGDEVFAYTYRVAPRPFTEVSLESQKEERRFDIPDGPFFETPEPPEEATVDETSLHAEAERICQQFANGEINLDELNQKLSELELAGKLCEALEVDLPLMPVPEPQKEWPDPTPEMLESPLFEAIWQCIKTWDVNVPGAYVGYCGATGNHVRAILDAIAKVEPPKGTARVIVDNIKLTHFDASPKPEPKYELPAELREDALSEHYNRVAAEGNNCLTEGIVHEELARHILIQARKDAAELVAEAMIAKGVK